MQSNEYAGILAGVIQNSSVTNCKIIDSLLKVQNYGGGISSSNIEGRIDSCVVQNLSIISAGVGGGIVSDNNNGSISNTSLDSVLLIAQSNVGGIAGTSLFGGIINNCTAHCVIVSENGDVGGVVGWAISTNIINCSTSGNIKSNGLGSAIGGVSGKNYNTTIFNCFSESSVSATNFGNVGGIAGFAELCIIQNCYSFNTEINQFEPFKSVFYERSLFNYIFLKLEMKAGYIVGNAINTQIIDCYYWNHIKSNKLFLIKKGGNGISITELSNIKHIL
ncbi:hypothetical protein MmiEs2_15610 [Methanimicrococcus stummii]|uniref:GLUG domain-containing protein n=1 Tax=Methanimicrococcus stummii TaxID=3028294 RepID=A0AA96V9M6_9EURY|nr:hypothetical protein MmiEs2_15610 [Methanimicrococcus sp. Es2]